MGNFLGFIGAIGFIVSIGMIANAFITKSSKKHAVVLAVVSWLLAAIGNS